MIDAREHSAVLRLAETTMEPCRPGFTRAIIRTPQMMSVVIDIIGGPWAEADPMHAHPHEQVTYVAAGEILFVAVTSRRKGSARAICSPFRPTCRIPSSYSPKPRAWWIPFTRGVKILLRLANFHASRGDVVFH